MAKACQEDFDILKQEKRKKVWGTEVGVEFIQVSTNIHTFPKNGAIKSTVSKQYTMNFDT